MTKRNQPPLVSTEARNRIRSFANDLVALCRRYEVEILWRSNGLIEVRDDNRKCYPTGYECDASFIGCDRVGIYSSTGFPLRRSNDIDIEDLQPCDWYVEEVKR